MTVFLTAKQLKNVDNKIATATKVFEQHLVSAAYQCVITGQVGLVSVMKKLTAMRGYGKAGSNLIAHLKLTDQMIEANKLGEKGKAHFKELRDAWAKKSEQEVYDLLMEIAFKKAEPKAKKSTQEKLTAYLGKIEVADLTADQQEKLRLFMASLTEAKPIPTPPALAAAEPVH